MASIPSRSLSRLAQQSRISRKPINIAQSATSANTALRPYTSISLTSFRSGSDVSHKGAHIFQKSFNSPVATAYLQTRGYAELKASGGKTEADLIVEELQELYLSPARKAQKRDRLTDNKYTEGMTTPKTNSKSQQTALTAPPSTPHPTVNLPANSWINCNTSTQSIQT
jgi:hypothetical protein